MAFFDELISGFEAILREILVFFPKIALVVLVFAVSLVLMKFVNRFVKWLVKTSRLEDLIRELVPGGPRIPLSYIFSILADLGITITAAAIAVRIFVPEYTQIYGQALDYLARVASVIVIALFFIFGLDAFVKAVKLEKKMDSFLLMFSFLLILTVLVDLTALSTETKTALDMGIALGMGLTIGAFAFWLFFSDHLESLIKRRNVEG